VGFLSSHLGSSPEAHNITKMSTEILTKICKLARIFSRVHTITITHH
jgi:hypothetical protein